jgi:hypothetical protein
MIRRFSLIAFLFIILASCSRKNHVIIRGKIENAGDQKVYIEELRLHNNRILDSCVLKNSGKIRFNLDIKMPGYYQLRMSEGQSLTLILSPGERLNIYSDFQRFYDSKIIEGSPNSIQVNQMHDSLRFVIKKLNILRDSYIDISEGTNASQDKLDSISIAYTKLRENYKNYTVAFILGDLNSLANIAALYQEYEKDDYVLSSSRDLQFFKLVSDTLNKYYPRVRYVKTLKNNYKSFFNEYQHARLMNMATSVETAVPDLILPDPAGIERSLKSLKGKIVLLSFWSVKQSESIQHVVELQRVYKKFRHKGFEVYQVSIDNSLPDWRKAIKFEEISWISVCDTAFPNSQTKMSYNVNKVPLNYLINKDQTEILARNITAKELDQTLNKLINHN